MHRRSVLGGLVVAAGGNGAGMAAPAIRRRAGPAWTPILDTLAMPVTPAENRQFSYTDKLSGYFHGRTHTDTNPDWFNGWNIATKRIFHDYALSVDGVPLDRAKAEVVVSPHKLVRRFEAATETLTLLVGLSVLTVGVVPHKGKTFALALKGDLTDTGTLAADGVWFVPKEAPGTHLLVAPMRAGPKAFDPISGVVADKAAGGFFLIHAATKPDARRILIHVSRLLTSLQRDRATRMEALVSGKLALDAGDADRTKALLWMRLTTDQLVMKQMGTGIYAGLPWFNDYWGRDTFISITGALFVTGQYDIAADLFRSFAALQDIDPNSKTYGRVPNRARPDGIEYNSADGTPRFIITLADLIVRSGNVALGRELWTAVKRAVEGVLKNNVDELGLITHDDADTWMDAKEKGLRAWSPRGNRAIDVQALWLEAFGAVRVLQNALEQAAENNRIFDRKVELAELNLSKAMTLFQDPQTKFLVDHLRPDGTRDSKIRPNVFFAIAHKERSSDANLEKLEVEMSQVRSLWENLVFPWGVATLSQTDPDFYPYHEHWHYYHKDAAYHNGTVWPWLNGIAIRQLLRFDQVDLAWRLFENMNRQALREGAVGSLSECADALPIEGANWARRTGTFLQAWSNAEHLAVWHEGFLGIRSDPKLIKVYSRLPSTIKDVVVTIDSPAGQLQSHYHVGGPGKWRFGWRGAPIAFDFRAIFGIERAAILELQDGDTVSFVWNGVQLLTEHINARKIAVESNRAASSDKVAILRMFEDADAVSSTEWKEQRAELQKRIFAGLDFCKPRLQPNLKSLSVRHDPPLTY